MENLMSVKEVADYLKFSQQHIRRLIREEKIKSEKIGKQWVISRENLKEYINKYDIVIEPDDHINKMKKKPKIKALSFFSGAMGLDLGMEKAGIPSILVCENDKHCRTTIEMNRPEIGLVGDITKLNIEKIREYAGLKDEENVDVIFGGPPCQAFSTAGKRKGFRDDRGNVFLVYLDIINQLKPKYVVIENVRGLLSAKYYPTENDTEEIKGGALYLILEKLKGFGYTFSFELYNAANFGAAQIRERVVIIAKRGDEKLPYLVPTNSDNEEYELEKWITLKDVIGDLNEEKQDYINFPEKRLKYYRYLKSGENWKNLPEDIAKEAMGKSYYLGGGKTGFFRRLSWDKPSPTLVTHPAMPATDLCHPEQLRPLSIQEYARIQGFPDGWRFSGDLLEVYKQIGNAVPIKLGEAIGKLIIDDIKGNKVKKIEGFKYSRYLNTNDKEWIEKIEKDIKKSRE